MLQALGAGALALGVPAVAADATDRTFVVEQGDTCHTVEPLGDGSQSVESFYQYGTETDYSSAGTTALQQPDTSLVFLYHGSNGLSLVFVHGAYKSDSVGGSASVTINRLPSSVSQAVEDDGYGGETQYDVWQRDGETLSVDWT
jgi:hypothetical protein